MNKIFYIDRKTKAKQEETIICKKGLLFLYVSKLGMQLEKLLARYSIFSRLSGRLHKTAWSRKKIRSFVEKNNINTSEFKKKMHEFTSFNDFFTRSLAPGARPIANNKLECVAPADGAYFVFPCIRKDSSFSVKFTNFCLAQFLQSPELAARYDHGSMVIARLAPFDYHRFHFPMECVPSIPRCINGYLHSVHPIALKNNYKIFCENKRMLSLLHSKLFGIVADIEVGAFNVGSIIQTYQPGEMYCKGDEKGFFEIGGSTIVLLFEKNKIIFDNDLIEASEQGLEMRCLMGQSIGKAFIE